MDTKLRNDSNAKLRQSVYGILICIGLGAMVGRILSVDSVDRRWWADTAMASQLEDRKSELKGQGLTAVEVDYGVKQEERQLGVRNGLLTPFLSDNDRSRWCTVRALAEPEMYVPGAPYAIDNVIQQTGWDTIDKVKHNGHFYSSKQPLLPTLMAAEYWLVQEATGMTLGTNPYEVGRFMLITINGLCLLLVFLFTARLVERLGTTDWGRILVMASCVLGTFLTTFANTITNHLPAAACTAVLLDAFIKIWFDGDRHPWTFVVAGLSSAMLVASEVPAAALSVVVGLIVLWLAPRKTMLACLPAALLVAAAFLATNWIAVQSLKPVQMHRGPGDNWYDYPGSYWNNRWGVDQGEKSAAVYSFHVLLGHHGILSLTPIWLLTALGGGLWLFRGERRLRELALVAMGVTLVCLAFYIWHPTVDRNYGGVASAFRWVFWMAPMWLALMLPATDLLSRRDWTRGMGLALLALSTLSASYPTWNPWSSPWIMDFLGYMGWL